MSKPAGKTLIVSKAAMAVTFKAKTNPPSNGVINGKHKMADSPKKENKIKTILVPKTSVAVATGHPKKIANASPGQKMTIKKTDKKASTEEDEEDSGTEEVQETKSIKTVVKSPPAIVMRKKQSKEKDAMDEDPPTNNGTPSKKAGKRKAKQEEEENDEDKKPAKVAKTSKKTAPAKQEDEEDEEEAEKPAKIAKTPKTTAKAKQEEDEDEDEKLVKVKKTAKKTAPAKQEDDDEESAKAKKTAKKTVKAKTKPKQEENADEDAAEDVAEEEDDEAPAAPAPESEEDEEKYKEGSRWHVALKLSTILEHWDLWQAKMKDQIKRGLMDQDVFVNFLENVWMTIDSNVVPSDYKDPVTKRTSLVKKSLENMLQDPQAIMIPNGVTTQVHLKTKHALLDDIKEHLEKHFEEVEETFTLSASKTEKKFNYLVLVFKKELTEGIRFGMVLVHKMGSLNESAEALMVQGLQPQETVILDASMILIHPPSAEDALSENPGDKFHPKYWEFPTIGEIKFGQRKFRKFMKEITVEKVVVKKPPSENDEKEPATKKKSLTVLKTIFPKITFKPKPESNASEESSGEHTKSSTGKSKELSFAELALRQELEEYLTEREKIPEEMYPGVILLHFGILKVIDGELDFGTVVNSFPQIRWIQWISKWIEDHVGNFNETKFFIRELADKASVVHFDGKTPHKDNLRHTPVQFPLNGEDDDADFDKELSIKPSIVKTKHGKEIRCYQKFDGTARRATRFNLFQWVYNMPELYPSIKPFPTHIFRDPLPSILWEEFWHKPLEFLKHSHRLSRHFGRLATQEEKGEEEEDSPPQKKTKGEEEEEEEVQHPEENGASEESMEETTSSSSSSSSSSKDNEEEEEEEVQDITATQVPDENAMQQV